MDKKQRIHDGRNQGVTTEVTGKTPFSLGFEGEHWHVTLQCLVVPVSGTDKTIMVFKSSTNGAYCMVTMELPVNQWPETDDLLMAAAMVQHRIVTIQGNREE